MPWHDGNGVGRRRFFDDVAPRWDELVATSGFLGRLAGAAAALDVAPDETVVDLGCGTGNLTRLLAGRLAAGHVLAVDYSMPMLARARHKLGGAAPSRVSWLCAGAAALPVASGAAHRVVCFSAWPHFDHPDVVAAELARVLRPGGLAHVLHVDSRETINRIHRHAAPAVANDLLPPAAELAALFGAAGLDVVEATDTAHRYLVTARARGRG
jgi:ubiquinone/menaquinone biosynthesis C-methylase UbiE